MKTSFCPIQCQENDNGDMDCKWVDDNGQEYTLYYSSDSEYIYFDQESRKWKALNKEVVFPSDEAMDGSSSTRAWIAHDAAPQPVRDIPRLVCEYNPPGTTVKACEWRDENGLLRTLRFDSATHYEHFNKFDWKWIILKKDLNR
jgi:hypothetical protein